MDCYSGGSDFWIELWIAGVGRSLRIFRWRGKVRKRLRVCMGQSDDSRSLWSKLTLSWGVTHSAIDYWAAALLDAAVLFPRLLRVRNSLNESWQRLLLVEKMSRLTKKPPSNEHQPTTCTLRTPCFLLCPPKHFSRQIVCFDVRGTKPFPQIGHIDSSLQGRSPVALADSKSSEYRAVYDPITITPIHYFSTQSLYNIEPAR